MLKAGSKQYTLGTKQKPERLVFIKRAQYASPHDSASILSNIQPFHAGPSRQVLLATESHVAEAHGLKVSRGRSQTTGWASRRAFQ